MDVNTGIVLIVLAFLLLMAELFVVSFGLLTVAGISALVAGTWILIQQGSLNGASPWLMAAIIILISVFMTFAVKRVIAVHKRQATTGQEELIGKTATAVNELTPQGMIMYKGELWSAVSEAGTIKAGEQVTILGIDGLKLHVKPKMRG